MTRARGPSHKKKDFCGTMLLARPNYFCKKSIVGKQHCLVLISGDINSDATGIDITTKFK